MRLMTHIAALICLAVAPCAVAASNETATLLKSHHVKHVLYVRVSGTELQYAIDSPNDFFTLSDDDTFTGQTQVDFAYSNFNPFLFKVETSEDLRDDPTSAAVAGFLQKLLDTAGVVLPNPALPSAENLKVQTVAVQGVMAQIAATPLADGCERYQNIHVALMQLRGMMNLPAGGQQVVKGWIDDATSAGGVKKVRASINDTMTAIDANEKQIGELLQKINQQFPGPKPGDGEAEIIQAFQNEDACSDIRASTFAALLDVSQLASKARAQKLAIRSNLQDLYKALEPFADATHWRDTSGYIFLKPTINPTKIDAITVKVTSRTIDDDKLTFTDGTPVKKKVDLRQYQRLIPEVAAAVIYTDLSYPTWGTGTNSNGQMIVQAGKPAHFPVQGAMVLNGVFPSGFASLYPAVQLGVSTAKDFPG